MGKKKNKKNKKSFNPIFEMLMQEEAAEKEDLKKEEVSESKSESKKVLSDNSDKVDKETKKTIAKETEVKKVTAAKKEAAQKVEVKAELNNTNEKEEVEKAPKMNLLNTEAAKEYFRFRMQTFGF